MIKRCCHCQGIIQHISEATTYRGYLIHKCCVQLTIEFAVRCRATRNIIIDEEFEVVQVLRGEEEVTWH